MYTYMHKIHLGTHLGIELHNRLAQAREGAPELARHTSAYVSIRQHTSAYGREHLNLLGIRQHMSAYVSIIASRQDGGERTT